MQILVSTEVLEPDAEGWLYWGGCSSVRMGRTGQGDSEQRSQAQSLIRSLPLMAETQVPRGVGNSHDLDAGVPRGLVSFQGKKLLSQGALQWIKKSHPWVHDKHIFSLPVWAPLLWSLSHVSAVPRERVDGFLQLTQRSPPPRQPDSHPPAHNPDKLLDQRKLEIISVVLILQ